LRGEPPRRLLEPVLISLRANEALRGLHVEYGGGRRKGRQQHDLFRCGARFRAKAELAGLWQGGARLRRFDTHGTISVVDEKGERMPKGRVMKGSTRKL
jgi:hypothetical protein